MGSQVLSFWQIFNLEVWPVHSHYQVTQCAASEKVGWEPLTQKCQPKWDASYADHHLTDGHEATSHRSWTDSIMRAQSMLAISHLTLIPFLVLLDLVLPRPLPESPDTHRFANLALHSSTHQPAFCLSTLFLHSFFWSKLFFDWALRRPDLELEISDSVVWFMSAIYLPKRKHLGVCEVLT